MIAAGHYCFAPHVVKMLREDGCRTTYINDDGKNVIMEQEITLRNVANYLDNIGIQFLATIRLDGKPKVRLM